VASAYQNRSRRGRLRALPTGSSSQPVVGLIDENKNDPDLVKLVFRYARNKKCFVCQLNIDCRLKGVGKSKSPDT